MILEKITDAKDLKQLNRAQLHTLVDEARTALLNKISQHGGHNGPNLGVVEMTVALHRVFNSPVDKLVFDISHQTYIHKMLTGRAQAFLDPAHFDDVSGYTNPKESEHDLFTVGHTSTSLALANGIAVARDLKQENYNVVALIGDGSLSGGLAFEGLNNIAEQNSNIIVIVNDNDQSIADNFGGLYRNLKALRESNGQAKDNFFQSLGFEYHYLDEGNDLDALIDLFESVKDVDHPVLLHVHTVKGKGFKFAEENREKFHAGGPFSLETGEYVKRGTGAKTYSNLTTEFLWDKMQKDKTVVAVNAGTPMMLFNPEQRKQLGKQFIDVGIAEQQAATMTAGLAKNGTKPVWAVYSTFMQRSYDQISHDLALNDLPGTILVYSASVNGMNDESHLGIFDIPFLSHIPNLVYLAPTNQEEYLAMLDWSLEQTHHPIAIRVPVGPLRSTGKADTTDYNQLYQNEVVQAGSKVAVMGVGNFFGLAEEVIAALAKENIQATLINPKFISGVDEKLLTELANNHQLVVTLEDGITDGGYGQTIASFLGNTDVKVQNYGLDKAFHDRYVASELLAENGITVENIVKNILAVVK
ncbi:1-deoxy-D-xylulose-5-phosphate synthase [Enterococcus cecorum]|uniref:1-deoxy-D-xylulose-5-phosphate synthase n=1 Tax=Enterococcus cecorum DSM 20682 = ATCC 43198 TaxID=1121864 RepID=S1QYJ4_9ENTE|nr:1-deoxy-D-xylulose-5-phosphate synthase [Enterococcus cecorum]EOX18801.1 1-deoxy-D-xylulose-5-phosphate synthase [Enterococcus cecorum DSM 20682 = ATCC 43198]ESK61470.1 1-deoxy-D-xylulose-5-phosphate synthase [Enterococcus cecorum DSM 20682 = ATCC 43198]OJG34418.1 1-deoxy-D-xylulose-5-phosphate synthase [Enterococcus cecorum DSM 20682 = ATCC 43198]CAI3415023.1 1-deoxy-D-xylulose-5-phosphate synthase [Enterococcus cecorum DSM 20682 = ATCC 43198]SQE57035.1 1-deoxy-D-xylulose-5-phosphate synth